MTTMTDPPQESFRLSMLLNDTRYRSYTFQFIALIALIQDAVSGGAQFIIATHSPILMALPGAQLLDVNQSPPVAVAWDDVEHVSLTRAFLNHPEAFLRHL